MKNKILEPVETMVQTMRKIREEISNEILDMTFSEERAFLDAMLLEANSPSKIKAINDDQDV